MKTTLVGVVGVGLIILISIAGCGGVNLAGLDMPDAGPLAETDATGAAGHDALVMQTDGGAGATGAAGTAAGEAGGTAGAAGRPLGAGCTGDTQCGSGICAKVNPGDPSGACCDGRPDTCTQCVGGYKVPRQDGNSCGDPAICDGTDRKWDLCKAGVCTHEVVTCATALCDKAGNKICPGQGSDGSAQTGQCNLTWNPCYCIDGAGSGNVSYPCP